MYEEEYGGCLSKKEKRCTPRDLPPLVVIDER